MTPEELEDLKRACKEAWRYASELEQERKRLSEELARALRVVHAVKMYADYLDDDSLADVKGAFREWEAGR